MNQPMNGRDVAEKTPAIQQFIMLRLHKFDSQLQCKIELNNRKTWTKYIKSKETLHDIHDNKTNVQCPSN